MTENEYIQLHVVLERVLEGNASEQEYVGLQKVIAQDESLKRYYFRYIELQAGLHQLKRLDSVSPLTPEHLSGFLSMLGQQEAEAERVDVQMTPSAPQVLIQKVVHEKTIRKINKASLVTAILSMAAVIFLIVFANFAPVKTGTEVAVLSDSVRARWADSGISLEPGTRLGTGDGLLLLREGLAEIVFDNHARITIEAPAEFKILTNDQIKLNYGRLYAVVPQEAMGFTVSTHSSKIIDLGTEFGVHGDLNGNVEVHVTRGRTLLTAVGTGEKNVLDVVAGQARKVIADSSAVQTIPIQENIFVRKIDSKTQFVWRGNPLSLADIVGGGDGFGSGVPDKGIDVFTGKVITHLVDRDTHQGSAGYRQVPDNPYVDGVFIPGIDSGRTQITSSGLSVGLFPQTSGYLWGYIFNGASHTGTKPPRHDLQLDNTALGTRENPAITIHSNQGITFDLSRIRDSIPHQRILAFRSLAGVSWTVQNQLQEERGRTFDDYPEVKKVFDANCAKVEFRVFLDGRQVYHCQTSSVDKAVGIDIPITDTDRFLTLVVTESDDTLAYDWALFGRPELVLELAEKQPSQIEREILAEDQ